MSSKPSFDSISDPNLRETLNQFIQTNPSAGHVITRLINYYTSKISSISSSSAPDTSTKKRKLDSPTALSSPDEPAVATIADVSLVTPLRKKLDILFTSTYLQFGKPGSQSELSFPTTNLTVGCLIPTPDKPTKNWTVAVFPSFGDAVAFGFPDSPPLSASPSSNEMKNDAIVLNFFQRYANLTLKRPTKEAFIAKAIPMGKKSGNSKQQQHEEAYHVTAYLKAKDGFLHFFPEGLLFGFKKPTLWIPLEDVQSITFLAIVQRTFNMAVQFKDGKFPRGNSSYAEPGSQLEFGMIAQEEFDNIAGYVNRFNLQDESLAERNKAPRATKKGKDETMNISSETKEEESDEEDDEDFNPDEDEDEVAEEYNSDVESDGEEGGDIRQMNEEDETDELDEFDEMADQ